MTHYTEVACKPPSTWFRRTGAVWCCECGELFTMGYGTSFDLMGLNTRKMWVKVSTVKELNDG
jgi:hypothetical protein